jgi:hypothetical protein
MKTKRNYFIEVVDEDGYDRQYVSADLVRVSHNKAGPNDPYKEIVLEVVGVLKQYNPDFGDDKICECGHTYYRHFDTYEGMAPVGCKYCGCKEFKLKETTGE